MEGGCQLDYVFDNSLVGVCNWVSLFLVGVRVGSLAMMVSMFLGRLVVIVFGVLRVNSSGKLLSHWFMAVSGSCAGYRYEMK